MRFVPILSFLLVIAVLVCMLIAKTTGPSVDRQIIKPLPDLVLNAADKHGTWDQKKLLGHVTVLNFFASWCAPCEAEMPELAAFGKTFPHVHLEGVAWNEEAPTLLKFLAKHGDPFRALWIDPNGEATIALGIQGIPETIIIDAKGMMRYRLRGPLTPELRASTIDPLIRQLLDEAAHVP